MTNSEGHTLDRYLAHAIEGALTTAVTETLIPPERRAFLKSSSTQTSASEVLSTVGGLSFEHVSPYKIPLSSNSIDLCHSGGALEHCRPETLTQYLHECYRVLRPGGIASHVFDHRDHLHHADTRRPFLSHLAGSQLAYTAFYGHPLLFHNRLLPEQIVMLFEEAGFECIAVRRMIYPDRRYVEGEATMEGVPGVDRGRLQSWFQNASEIDLRSAAVHYLYRKPG